MSANDPPLVLTDVALDHVIFYAGQALGELAAVFERLGFTLTPPGRHSSGSVNRLAILGNDYLELIGFAPGTPATVRPELQSLPLGLSGIAAADPQGRVRERAPEAFLPARRLERSVDMPGVQGLAAFTTTELRQAVPDVRVFLCRHHTPELVWHPAWQRHANGVVGVREMQLRTRDPRALEAALRTVFGADAARAPERGAEGLRIRIAPLSQPASITLRTTDLAAARAVLVAAGMPHHEEETHIRVALPQAYGTEIVFVPT